jgi:adenosylcobinamide-GDP ribazoletransferase
VSGLRQATAFLTPLGGAATPTADAVAWFPVVGAALGGVLGLVWLGAERLWPPLLVAVLVVALDLALTGMLHTDGLADSADGLLPHLPAERRLEVMATPDVGAFGVAVVTATIVLRVAAIASLTAAPLLIAGLWCASRSLMAVTACRVPYARSGGLASAFLGSRVVAPAAGLVLAVGLGAGWRPVAGSVAVIVGLAAGAGVVALGRRRVGGFTGDVLGAAGVVTETVGLVVAAARW